MKTLSCRKNSLFLVYLIVFGDSLLLHTQLSKTSNFFLKISTNVQVSAAYSATLQMVLFTIFFFRSIFNLRASYFFFSMKAFFAIAILHLTSFSQYPSSEMTDPRYLKWFTCSTCCPSIRILTFRPPCRAMHITFVFFTLIFIPYFWGTLLILSISSCSPFSLLATTGLSSANLTVLITFIPHSTSYKASLIVVSSSRLYSKGENVQSCCTPTDHTRFWLTFTNSDEGWLLFV